MGTRFRTQSSEDHKIRHELFPPDLVVLCLGRRCYDDEVPVRRREVQLLEDLPPLSSPAADLGRPRHLRRDERARRERGVVQRVLARIGGGHHPHAFSAAKWRNLIWATISIHERLVFSKMHFIYLLPEGLAPLALQILPSESNGVPLPVPGRVSFEEGG